MLVRNGQYCETRPIMSTTHALQAHSLLLHGDQTEHLSMELFIIQQRNAGHHEKNVLDGIYGQINDYGDFVPDPALGAVSSILSNGAMRIRTQDLICISTDMEGVTPDVLDRVKVHLASSMNNRWVNAYDSLIDSSTNRVAGQQMLQRLEGMGFRQEPAGPQAPTALQAMLNAERTRASNAAQAIIGERQGYAVTLRVYSKPSAPVQQIDIYGREYDEFSDEMIQGDVIGRESPTIAAILQQSGVAGTHLRTDMEPIAVGDTNMDLASIAHDHARSLITTEEIRAANENGRDVNHMFSPRVPGEMIGQSVVVESNATMCVTAVSAQDALLQAEALLTVSKTSPEMKDLLLNNSIQVHIPRSENDIFSATEYQRHLEGAGEAQALEAPQGDGQGAAGNAEGDGEFQRDPAATEMMRNLMRQFGG